MKYQRFWDLVIAASDGHCDFANELEHTVAYRTQKMEMGGGQAMAHLNLVQVMEVVGTNGVLSSRGLAGQQLPKSGYVASMISFKDIRGDVNNDEVEALIRWILEPGSNQTPKGNKLRVTVHGNSGGDIGMSRKDETVDTTSMSDFMTWMTRHGLRGKAGQQTGLDTMALQICHSAARWGYFWKSSMEHCVDGLAKAGLKGVTVTGSAKEMEVVTGVPFLELFKNEWAIVGPELKKLPDAELDVQITKGLDVWFGNLNGRAPAQLPGFQAATEAKRLHALASKQLKIAEMEKLCLLYCQLNSARLQERQKVPPQVRYDPFTVRLGQTGIIDAGAFTKLSKSAHKVTMRS